MPLYLKENGPAVLRNGYNIVPIKPGGKGPVGVPDFLTKPTTPKRVENWLSNGHARDGIGITTRDMPCVDIDSPDFRCSIYMFDQTVARLGMGIVKIGQPPKRALIYRCEKPFRKISSRVYRDDAGRKAQLEILGDGQQTVIYHIHPDTHKPYFYPGKLTPLNTPASDLPVMTEADGHALVEIFHQYAESRGWQSWREPAAALPVPAPRAVVVADDDLGLDNRIVEDLSDEELRERLMSIPNDERFDAREDWFKIICAVSHQTQKSDDGRDMAWEWTSQRPMTANDEALFEKAWNSLGKYDDDRQAITSLYILKLTPEYTSQKNAKSVADIVAAFEAAQTVVELERACVDARKLHLGDLHFATLLGSLRAEGKRITRQLLPVGRARAMLMPEVVAAEWTENWCYLSEINRFFNTKTKELIDKDTFNSKFLQYIPETSLLSPHAYALAKVKIPQFYNALYLPAAEDTFHFDGNLCVNLYNPESVPAIPRKASEKEIADVRRVRDHFKHLFPDERERELLISWHAYIVQTRDRPNWAVVMQGVEGDGRSMIGNMMAGVLGGKNCRVTLAKTLESQFTAWASGQLYTIIEEVRMVGHNRYDILNSIKPLITNETIEVHRKGIDPYNAPNTTAYAATTNYKNALPLDSNDRRYFVVMSQWQTASDLNKFKADNPDYYDSLYAAVSESPGAIRKWLLGYKLHPEFRAKGIAPMSEGRRDMAELNKSDTAIDIADAIREEGPDVSSEMVMVGPLMAMIADESGELISGAAIKTTLSELGFKYLGRFQIDGERESVWVKNNRRFPLDPEKRRRMVRKMIYDHRKAFNEV